MKTRITTLFAVALLTVAGGSGALAQGSPAWVIVPVDLWTCTFNERQSMRDLDNWVTRFNAWADGQDTDDYAAWTLTPSYYGPDQEFDFIWLGAWKDANAMGQGWDLWNSTNGNLMQEFLAISTCDVHANFASAAYRLPRGLDNSQGGVMTVSDCKNMDGVPGSAVDGAMRRWVDILDEAGSRAAIYHWYPVFGGGSAEFDFKEITVYQNYADLGADYERMGNGGLYARGQDLFEHLVHCDDARVYNVRTRRFVDLRGGG